MLWRFGAGVLGGWPMVALVLLMIIGGYVCFGLVLFNPTSHFNRMSGTVEMGAIASAAAFLLAMLSITVLRNAMRWHPIARLAPNARIVITALTWRIAIIAVIALLPAFVLRAAAWVKIPATDEASASLFDIAPLGYFSAALYVLHVAVLIALTFGPLKVPLRFAFLPIQFGAFSFVTRGWSWWTLIFCAVLVVGCWFWRRFQSQLSLSPPRRIGPEAARPNAISQWRHAKHVQRIVRAHAAGSTRARVTALLATQSTSSFTVASIIAATLYLALKPGFMDTFVVSWLMALPIAVLLSMPPAIPLSRIMLLPLGAERARVGQIIAAVWARQIRTRLLICVAGGLSLHALFWWLEWPAFIRSPFFTPVDPATHLLWSPLAQAAGLYGMAMSACLLATASPRLLQRSGFLLVVPWLALIGLAALSLPLKWWLNDAIPATAGQDMGHITFAIVNGAMLPACAWCIHRALRHQWSTANLAAVSAAMQKWSARFQKAHSME